MSSSMFSAPRYGQIAKYVQIAMIALAVGCAKKTPEPATPDPAPAPAPAPAPEPAPEPVSDYGPIIDPVLFQTGGTAIAADQMGAIDKAAAVLKDSDWTVLVVGLADASGDVEANKVISEKRATVVADELRKRIELPAERIVTHGVGEKLATGATQSERKVEFVFYHDKGLPLKQVVIKSGVLEEDFRAKKATEGGQ